MGPAGQHWQSRHRRSQPPPHPPQTAPASACSARTACAACSPRPTGKPAGTGTNARLRWPLGGGEGWTLCRSLDCSLDCRRVCRLRAKERTRQDPRAQLQRPSEGRRRRPVRAGAGWRRWLRWAADLDGGPGGDLGLLEPAAAARASNRAAEQTRAVLEMTALSSDNCPLITVL